MNDRADSSKYTVSGVERPDAVPPKVRGRAPGGRDMSDVLPGDDVLVFDTRLYVDDRKTPPTVTMQSATVLRRYGKRSEYGWIYPDLVDVRFHRDGQESLGHFTDYVVKQGAETGETDDE